MIPDLVELISVTDTCALWNLVGANTLFHAALGAKLSFVITQTVAYECFVKTRGRPLTAKRQGLRKRLQAHLDAERVSQMTLSIDDLQATLDLAGRLGVKKRLGQGELSCAALVRKLGHSAVLTDNRRDTNAIDPLVDGRVQTTPRLLGWLLFAGHLTDSDVQKVIGEHETNDGDLAPIYRNAHSEACEKRLAKFCTK